MGRTCQYKKPLQQVLRLAPRTPYLPWIQRLCIDCGTKIQCKLPPSRLQIQLALLKIEQAVSTIWSIHSEHRNSTKIKLEVWVLRSAKIVKWLLLLLLQDSGKYRVEYKYIIHGLLTKCDSVYEFFNQTKYSMSSPNIMQCYLRNYFTFKKLDIGWGTHFPCEFNWQSWEF